jgi:hypothetical protein
VNAHFGRTCSRVLCSARNCEVSTGSSRMSPGTHGSFAPGHSENPTRSEHCRGPLRWCIVPVWLRPSGADVQRFRLLIRIRSGLARPTRGVLRVRRRLLARFGFDWRPMGRHTAAKCTVRQSLAPEISLSRCADCHGGTLYLADGCCSTARLNFALEASIRKVTNHDMIAEAMQGYRVRF